MTTAPKPEEHRMTSVIDEPGRGAEVHLREGESLIWTGTRTGREAADLRWWSITIAWRHVPDVVAALEDQDDHEGDSSPADAPDVLAICARQWAQVEQVGEVPWLERLGVPFTADGEPEPQEGSDVTGRPVQRVSLRPLLAEEAEAAPVLARLAGEHPLLLAAERRIAAERYPEQPTALGRLMEMAGVVATDADAFTDDDLTRLFTLVEQMVVGQHGEVLANDACVGFLESIDNVLSAGPRGPRSRSAEARIGRVLGPSSRAFVRAYEQRWAVPAEHRLFTGPAPATAD